MAIEQYLPGQMDLEDPPGQPGLRAAMHTVTAKALTEQPDTEVGGIAADRLRSIIERVERLEEERKGLADDIRDIFAEAKSAGFEVKIVRAILRLRKQEPADVEEQETLLDLYRRALGM